MSELLKAKISPNGNRKRKLKNFKKVVDKAKIKWYNKYIIKRGDKLQVVPL